LRQWRRRARLGSLAPRGTAQRPRCESGHRNEDGFAPRGSRLELRNGATNLSGRRYGSRGSVSGEKRALVLVMSLAHNDPRVRRQLTWLTSDGWSVDTVGIGPVPSDEVSDHFAIGQQKAWVRSRWGVLITYLLLPKRVMFRRL